MVTKGDLSEPLAAIARDLHCEDKLVQIEVRPDNAPPEWIADPSGSIAPADSRRMFRCFGHTSLKALFTPKCTERKIRFLDPFPMES